jgi:hypothetical protein
MSDSKDHEWLLLRERGEDVSHISASTRAKYDRLATLFEALPGATPSRGWKQPILATLDELSAQDPPAAVSDGPPVRDIATARRRWPRRWTLVLAGGLATMAAIAVVFAWCHGDPGQHKEGSKIAMAVAPGQHKEGVEIAIGEDPATTEIRRGGQPHRGDDVAIGDTLVVRAKAEGPFELRVYGDTGEPLARCSEAHGCTVERDGNVRRIRLEIELKASGDVRAVLFTGDSIPEAFVDLNTDAETAQRAGVDAHQIAVIHVQ